MPQTVLTDSERTLNRTIARTENRARAHDQRRARAVDAIVADMVGAARVSPATEYRLRTELARLLMCEISGADAEAIIANYEPPIIVAAS